MLFKASLLIILLAVSYSTQAASHHPQVWLKTIAGLPDEGERIVDHYCANCHAMHPRIVLGAPRIHQKHDWQHRLAQGMAILFKHTNEGYNAMPARGGCFECTDHQLYLAILAMLPHPNNLSHSPSLQETQESLKHHTSPQ